MKKIRFGIIGCGAMAREFASAVARWCHFTDMDVQPEIIALANRTLSQHRIQWFTDHFPLIEQVTSDYREVLANDRVDAVYAALPHNMHAEVYCAALKAGKHLLGEKPFGMDLAASQAIQKRIQAHPAVLARCASQLVFFPGVQRILTLLEQGRFGRIIEVDSGFLHSSDLDPNKPINWKRMPAINGDYGPMGDLGAHVAMVPFRAGWEVLDTRAICSNIITERPDAHGHQVPCDTWDNVTLLSTVNDPAHGNRFPWTLRTHRIMPGEMNTWYMNVYGTLASARFSLRHPKQMQILDYTGGDQNWQTVELGFVTPYKTITGTNFEFGALDAILQMIGAFLYELSHGKPLNHTAACPTPQEMHGCHRLFTAALESHRTCQTIVL
ncbi:MAG: Gfo/Idh/MocA family oxidoreductase [Phycisphaerae bacterium]|nr:Gfo/Idh/MocA family oxidoreductase [Phycisphaerae bacterium]